MCAPTKMQLCDMVTNSWNEISKEMVRKAFVVCGQVSDVDVNKIVCFKEGRSCFDGKAKLE